jgi:hypothetical protein
VINPVSPKIYDINVAFKKTYTAGSIEIGFNDTSRVSNTNGAPISPNSNATFKVDVTPIVIYNPEDP